MPGSLLGKARRDSKKYVTAGGFQEDITLVTPDGSTTLQTTGFASKHWINFDTDGNAINAKNAHICVDQDELEVANYPYLKGEEVHLYKHRVTTKDSSGENKQYVVKEHYPDETLGLIVCILGDYEPN